MELSHSLLKMIFVEFSILLLSLDFAVSAEDCLSQTPCRCVLPNKTVIDLSSVGSPYFPRFYDILFDTNCSKTDSYFYNPCFAFNFPDKHTTLDPDHKKCNEASACVKGSGGREGQFPEVHAIGFQETAKFGFNTNKSLYYINYTVPASDRVLRVFLICNKSKTVGELNVTIPECNKTATTIELTLTSKCACPDGCSSSLPPSPSSSRGLSTGSKLLIAFFTILLAYLIIGVVWNYCNGSHGTALIPNIEFWNDLPTLIMEGVGFTCSCCVNKRSYGEV